MSAFETAMLWLVALGVCLLLGVAWMDVLAAGEAAPAVGVGTGQIANHGATAGVGGGLWWVLHRLRKVEMLSARLEVENEHLKAELGKGSDKFERIDGKLDDLKDEVHELALHVKNGGK